MSDEVCHVEMRNRNPCGRQTYKDKKKCIFHLENKSDEEAKIFEIMFWQELARMEKDDDIRELDFTCFIFPARIGLNGHLFEKIVDFSHAQFDNIAVFSHAQFNNIAVFSVAQFNKNAYFTVAQFNKNAYFSIVQFKESAYFHGAQFNYEATFEDAVFLGAGYFIGTKFLSSNKDLISFEKNVISFENVKFHKPKDVRFQNIDLSNVSFLNTDVTEVELLDVTWSRKNGRLAVIDETRIGKDYYSTTYGAVAQLYRRLRRNYETNYRFAEAGDFFIGEMEMRRYDVTTNITNEKIRNIVLWFKRNFSLIGLYKHLSLYGESYVRPAIWAFVIVVSYPMILNLLYHLIFNDPLINYVGDFLNTYPIRKSAASFFQMDNTYVGERIIGIPILGLLFMALKRKFERKK